MKGVPSERYRKRHLRLWPEVRSKPVPRALSPKQILNRKAALLRAKHLKDARNEREL